MQVRYYYLKNYQGNNSVVLNQNGVVQQINHYYPYGSLMGEGFNASSQPYRYGGKELVTLGGLNLSDFGARWLDSPNGTFTTMDPLCEDFQHLSPYLYCAGNPIKYIDPSGMVFTDVAQQYANKLITEAVLKIVGAITNKDVDWKVVSQASSTINEVIALKNSSQEYDVVEDRSLGANYGETRVNCSNKRIEIALGDMGVSMDLIAHEFKHLYQFETGMISLTEKGKKGYGHFLYDKTDEVEAYSRGYIFGGTKYSNSNLPSHYDSLPNKNFNILSPELSNVSVSSDSKRINHVLNQLCNYYKQTFRYNGITYFYIQK